MGLIDWLDKITMGKENFNKDKNETSTLEYQIKNWKDKVEKKEYEEGILHVKATFITTWAGARTIYEKTVEGKVIGFGELNDKTCFVLETPKGIDTLEFSEKFSQDRKDNLKNQKIKYLKISDIGSYSAHVNSKYRIDVLEGPLKGEFFEKKEFNIIYTS